MTTWLPRSLTSAKPWAARIAQISRSETTRSLPNRDLEAGDVDLGAQPASEPEQRLLDDGYF